MNRSLRLTAMATALAILSTGMVLADEMAGKGADAVKPSLTPAASRSAAKTKAKTAKKKVTPVKTAQEKYVWVCPMGCYSGAQTKDGKCPECHMDLVKQKLGQAAPASEKKM